MSERVAELRKIETTTRVTVQVFPIRCLDAGRGGQVSTGRADVQQLLINTTTRKLLPGRRLEAATSV